MFLETMIFTVFASIMAVDITSCKQLRNVTFCDVLHESKQINMSKLQRVGRTEWKSSLTSVT